MMPRRITWYLLAAVIVIVLFVPLCSAEDKIFINENGVVGSNDIEQDGNVFRFTGIIYKPILVEIDDVVIDGGMDERFQKKSVEYVQRATSIK